MKRWSIIFKIFGNINRLKIVKILLAGRRWHVSEIAREIHLSQKATSKHLIILHNHDVLHSVGRDGHVFYYINTDIPKDLGKVVKLLS